MVVQVKQGHVLDVLAGMPAKSVHVAVTSPPYWGLRAYQTPPQVWCEEADERCAQGHEWGPAIVDHKRGADAGPSAQVATTKKRVCPPETQQGAFCTCCGAWRGELGSEPTLDLFVSHLVTVFEAVKRVMRDDGTLWVNLGDSYSTHAAGKTDDPMRTSGLAGVRTQEEARANKVNQPYRLDRSLPEGNLCMAPARFALAMQAAGWRLRSEITLCKTAPMPESVQGARWERCRTKLTNGSRNTGTRSVGANPAHGNRDVGSFESDEGRAEWADCPGCPKCAATDGLVQRWGSGRPTSATEKLYVFTKGTGAYFYDTESVRVRAEYGYRSAFRSTKYLNGHAQETNHGEPTEPSPSVTGRSENGSRNLWNYVMWAEPEYVRLRDDLTPEQRAYVLRRIADAGSPSSDGTAASRSGPPDA